MILLKITFNKYEILVLIIVKNCDKMIEKRE